VEVDSFYPEAGETAKVHVRSGHYFPKSVLTLSKKVMQGVVLRTPDKRTLSVDIIPGDREWTGAISRQTKGVHVVTFSLKRARADKPQYEGKTILVVGDGPDLPADYAVGSGLELVPAKSVSDLNPGDELPVLLVLDGAAVGGSVEVTPENGRAVFVKTEPGRPAVVTVRNAGRYLVTAGLKGRGCSLVFQVRGIEGGSR